MSARCYVGMSTVYMRQSADESMIRTVRCSISIKRIVSVVRCEYANLESVVGAVCGRSHSYPQTYANHVCLLAEWIQEEIFQKVN